MEVINTNLIPGEVRTDKEQNNIVPTEIINYMNLFVDCFNDEFMRSVFNQARKTSFLSSKQLEVISKRKKNIPVFEDQNKTISTYLKTYIPTIILSELAIMFSTFRSPQFESNYEERDIIIKLVTIFHKIGYLSEGQIKYHLHKYSIWPSEAAARLPREIKSNEKVKRLVDENFESITGKVDKFALAGFLANSNVTEEWENDSLLKLFLKKIRVSNTKYQIKKEITIEKQRRKEKFTLNQFSSLKDIYKSL